MFFILALVVIPLAAGYVANFVVGKGKGFQPWELFVAGIVGSFVGGLLLNLVTGDGLGDHHLGSHRLDHRGHRRAGHLGLAADGPPEGPDLVEPEDVQDDEDEPGDAAGS